MSTSHLGKENFSQEFNFHCVSFNSPIPCASLLIRIVQAACHPNGRPKEVGDEGLGSV